VSRELVLDDLIHQRQPFGGVSTYWQCLRAGLAARGTALRIAAAPRRLALRPAVLRDAVFHGSYLRVALGPGVRNVVTVHDLIVERRRVETRSGLASRALRRFAVRAADAIVCVSAATRAELEAVYGHALDGKRVVIARHGGPLSMPAAVRPPLPAIRPYAERERRVLFVGTRDGYKNFPAALQGFRDSALPAEGFTLTCTGHAFTREERALVAALGLAGAVEHAGVLPAAELWQLYARSLALVYPSREEGFGLPVLEAMSFGCVPVASSIPALREVVADAVPLFEPDGGGFGQGLRAAVEPARWEALSQASRRRAAGFDWADSVERHLAVYRELGAA